MAKCFADPPTEYGPVDGWWWEAGRLDRERLRWQLEEFKDKGIAGTWFYGRYLYDEPLASDPRYFSDGWWEFTRFASEEQRRLGLRNFFSVWTMLEFEQDALRQQREAEPQLWGRRLVVHRATSDSGGLLALEIPEGDEVLDAAAYRIDGEVVDYSSRVALSVADRRLDWDAPDSGWVLTVIAARPWDLDYLDPEVGRRWPEVVLAEYERRLPGAMGRSIEAFGPDEMTLLNGTTIFSPGLLERMRSEAGYDPTPYLIALFHDVGDRTDEIRCRYYDAMCALLEEHFYRAPTRWLHERGMTHATISQLGDGPLGHTFHYGDFMRYLRSFDIPGNEDPGRAAPGERRLLQSKTSSSVTNLHGSGRAVVLAHYLSGWGHTLEENLAWTNEAYAYGMNLYSRHLGSYSLMGGWYEYVPPHDHFYHPYWRYWKHFADYVRRLSFLMSQGKHRADVALLYPISTIHAHWVAGAPGVVPAGDRPVPSEATSDPGTDDPAAKRWDLEEIETAFEAMDAGMEEAIKTTFGPAAHEAANGMVELAGAVYRGGFDFDVVSNDALAAAKVSDGVLEISGVEFRSVLLPPMTTIPIDVAEQIKRYHDAGGTVVAFGRVPEASVEAGRGDPRLARLIDDVFGANGRGILVAEDVSELPRALSGAIVPDVAASEAGIFHCHRKLGELDVYLLFNTEERERELTVRLRVDAEVERWDPFTGAKAPVHRVTRDADGTAVDLRMGIYEAVVLVCSPGRSRARVIEDDVTEIVAIEADGPDVLVVRGFADDGGRKRARVERGGVEYAGGADVAAPPAPIAVEGPWSFRLEPTMDNRWGDFRHPPSKTLIGAEARRFRYRTEHARAGTELGWHVPDLDDAEWPEVTYSHGPYWRHLGPIEPDAEPEGTLERALRGDHTLDWRPLEFSMRFGSERQKVGWTDMEHLLGVSNNFLVFDRLPDAGPRHHYLFSFVEPPEAGEYRFVFGHSREHEMVSLPRSVREADEYQVPVGTQLWVNGEQIAAVTEPVVPELAARVRLGAGRNAVLLKVVQPDERRVTNYAAFTRDETAEPDPYVPALRWSADLRDFVYDAEAGGVGWYRFTAPPGTRAMRLRARLGAVEAWVDGQAVPVQDDMIALSAPRPVSSRVALRVEHLPGAYAGAVFEEPIAFECDEGVIELGDWSDHGLATYSGIGVYATEIRLTAARVEHRVVLELGQVKTVAELAVNGQPAGVRLARPYRFDITELVREGENRIEVKVANTLANHMSSYPTLWVLEGQTVSGLLGPVELRFSAPVELVATRAPEPAMEGVE